jgi:hypothetical protein
MPILKMQRSIEAKGISLAIQGIPRTYQVLPKRQKQLQQTPEVSTITA